MYNMKYRYCITTITLPFITTAPQVQQHDQEPQEHWDHQNQRRPNDVPYNVLVNKIVFRKKIETFK